MRPLDPSRVLEAMRPYPRNGIGNPSGDHFQGPKHIKPSRLWAANGTLFLEAARETAASTGSACHSGELHSSEVDHVMRAAEALASVRQGLTVVALADILDTSGR
jgi:hypothetical protein